MSHTERYRKAQRLRGVSVTRMLATTRPRRAGLISVQINPNGFDYSRLGLIVPKRYLPRAVDRNRAKRVLREWFRRNQTRLLGHDLLVRLSSRTARLDTLVADIEHALAPVQ